MSRIPQRHSLVTETAAILREAIAGGEWNKGLPGELELSNRLRVSRTTIRAALAALQREGLISSGQGRRREIRQASAPANKLPASESVALLTPEPLHRLNSTTVFWIDALREHLASHGWTLRVVVSAATYRQNPGTALSELAAREKAGAWVLYRSTEQIQRWFETSNSPCVVAGTVHTGVRLTSVDRDYRAASHHAAGVLLGRGHRQLGLLRPSAPLAGDLETEAGFREGLTNRTAATLHVAEHNGTPAGVTHALRRMLAGFTPTAIYVIQSTHFATVMTWLSSNGYRIPTHISLISRDDDPFLDHLFPEPARYSLDPASFARKISRQVLDLVRNGSETRRQYLVMPTFVPGGTIASRE